MANIELPLDKKSSKAYTCSSGLHQDFTETADTRNRPRIEGFYDCDQDDDVDKLKEKDHILIPDTFFKMGTIDSR